MFLILGEWNTFVRFGKGSEFPSKRMDTSCKSQSNMSAAHVIRVSRHLATNKLIHKNFAQSNGGWPYNAIVDESYQETSPGTEHITHILQPLVAPSWRPSRKWNCGKRRGWNTTCSWYQVEAKQDASLKPSFLTSQNHAFSWNLHRGVRLPALFQRTNASSKAPTRPIHWMAWLPRATSFAPMAASVVSVDSPLL